MTYSSTTGYCTTIVIRKIDLFQVKSKWHINDGAAKGLGSYYIMYIPFHHGPNNNKALALADDVYCRLLRRIPPLLLVINYLLVASV